MERIKVKQINDHIWLLNDNDESTGYLVTGSERGLIIDTMTGYGNVRKVAEEITDFPLTVVNTHGHPDHIYGNVYFEKVYIHPADIPVAERFYQDPAFVAAIRQMNRKPAEFLTVTEGDVFDLGGLALEVYELPGHTPGGIVLLDRKDRILFSGDSILEQTWMQLPECLPMEQFLASLDKIQKMREEFDYLLTGHNLELVDASFCEVHRKAVWEVCVGIKDNDEPYSYFGGTCMAHPYGKEPRRIVYQGGERK